MPVKLSMVVPVSQTVPVQIDLGGAGLDPVVGELRSSIGPIKFQVERLPDKIGGLP